MQPVEVSPPPVNALRIGLQSGGRNPPEPGKWQLGITYDPYFDHLGGLFPVEECLTFPEELDPGDLEKVIPDGNALSTWFPYTLWLGDTCSAMGGRTDYEARIRAQLGAQTSRLLELAFSGGIIPISAAESYTFAELGYPNRPLESVDAVDLGGPYHPVTAISLLVEEMANQIGSTRGMIHVPHFVLPYLDAWRQVVRNPGDGTFITLASHDHIVIAGTGYRGFAPDGTDPGPGVAWAYGTSLVDVRLDEVELLPGSPDEAMDIRQNLIEYRGERLALASWDLSAHAAIAIDLSDPGTTGS